MTLKLNLLKDVAKQYLNQLSGWKLFGNNVIGRISSPVFQGICFNRSSGDDYLPMCFINALCRPNESDRSLIRTFELCEGLSGRRGGEWHVHIRAHDRDFLKILDAMQQQFKPSICLPLNGSDVLPLYEEHRAATVSAAFMNAYYGHIPKSLEFIKDSLSDLKNAIQSDWVQFEIRSLHSLTEWIKTNRVDAELKQIVQQNLAGLKWTD